MHVAQRATTAVVLDHGVGAVHACPWAPHENGKCGSPTGGGVVALGTQNQSTGLPEYVTHFRRQDIHNEINFSVDETSSSQPQQPHQQQYTQKKNNRQARRKAGKLIHEASQLLTLVQSWTWHFPRLRLIIPSSWCLTQNCPFMPGNPKDGLLLHRSFSQDC